MLDRIKQLMDAKHFTSSQFADGMDVPRAVLSHILSGRNKPSLDVVLKIASSYTDVSLEWLLLGKGEMLTNLAAKPLANQDKNHDLVVEETLPVMKPDEPVSSSKVQKQEVVAPTASAQVSGDKAIKQVMFFYTDGTFETFKPDC